MVCGMSDYDINRLARRRRAKGQAIDLPKIEETAKARVQYLRVLRRMLREVGRRSRRARDQFDFEQLAALAVHLSITAEAMVSRILWLESQRHTETFKATVKRALGIDLAQVVRQEDLTEYLRTASLRNAGLIKNLGDDAVRRVQQTVTTALINGRPVKQLQAELTEQLRISDRRAQLIAQDQMAKLNSDLNRIRHQQAGITQYRWLTSRDERVRARHRDLEGKVYKYGEPTGAEGGLPPGQPIRCRCVAVGIVEF